MFWLLCESVPIHVAINLKEDAVPRNILRWCLPSRPLTPAYQSQVMSTRVPEVHKDKEGRDTKESKDRAEGPLARRIEDCG